MPSAWVTTSGKLLDIEEHVRKLHSSSALGFLIIEAPGSDRALTLVAERGETELDIPLQPGPTTPHEAARKFCTDHGLRSVAEPAGDGSHYLMCTPLPRDPAAVAALVCAALQELFFVDSTVQLRFRLQRA